MPTIIETEEFLTLSEKYPVMDVRTPAEFEVGHFPGAFNLPLFSNEDRVIIGTLYKKEGRETAILKGLELTGPKFKDIIKSANKINKGRTVLVHCWRGGMRSASIAFLLELYGYKVYLLKGGYKSFRKKVLDICSESRKLLILGGRTGSGKTIILGKLLSLNEQVIDLEDLANHKGSSFGALGEEKQPTQEQFENELAFSLRNTDRNKLLWVEDESRLVGKKVIPAEFWAQMRNSKVIYIDIPFEERAEYLTAEYGKFNSMELKDAVLRVEKRLGGLNTKLAIEAIDAGYIQKACEILLSYYDKSYDFGISKREPSTIEKISFKKSDAMKIAAGIIKHSNK